MAPTATMEPFHLDGCQPDFFQATESDWGVGDIFITSPTLITPTRALTIGSLDEFGSLSVEEEPNMVSESVESNQESQHSQNVSCSVHTDLLLHIIDS